jgi:NADH-quinone oxidoreductase subunit C
LPDETPSPDEPVPGEPVPDEVPAAAAAVAVSSAPSDPRHVELLGRLRSALGAEAVVDAADVHSDLVVRVASSAWHGAARAVRDQLECDYLSFISGIDWMPAAREGDEAGGDTSSPVQPTETTYGATGSAGRFQVFARVQSTARHWGITLKTDVDEDDPRLASWVDVYPGADWHERECWEMFGVVFEGHPALRHLYLPAEFEGHPLRKDFALLARVVKPWPGLVNVEPMPGSDADDDVATEVDA